VPEREGVWARGRERGALREERGRAHVLQQRPGELKKNKAYLSKAYLEQDQEIEGMQVAAFQ